jgi:hypothetical protein
MDIIKLPARYGYCHTLEYIGGNLWKFKSDPNSGGYCRCIGFEGEHKIGPNIKAFDPDGGPFMSVGDVVEDYIIKSITTQGIFELVKK